MINNTEVCHPATVSLDLSGVPSVMVFGWPLDPTFT
jgi:hypothetical protein